MNKFERHQIDLNKPEMDNWPILSNIVKFTQYDHLQTDIDIKAPVGRQTMNIFAELENDEWILKDIDCGKYADMIKKITQICMKVKGEN